MINAKLTVQELLATQERELIRDRAELERLQAALVEREMRVQWLKAEVQRASNGAKAKSDSASEPPLATIAISHLRKKPPLNTTELLESLKQKGHKIKGKNPQTALYVALMRRPNEVTYNKETKKWILIDDRD